MDAIKLEDLASTKLAGIYKSDARRARPIPTHLEKFAMMLIRDISFVSNSLNSSRSRYLSILDYETGTYVGPVYRGKFLDPIFAPAKLVGSWNDFLT